MKFYLGTHMISQKWWDERIPLFVSRRRLTERRAFPRARVGWALDSGGFTELDKFHGWRTTEADYVADVRRFEKEIGLLEWVAPMDWMCEPHMLVKTGLTIAEHQRRTVDNFVRLREQLGALVIPVIQGWSADDYLRCWSLYHRAGVDLEWETTVGVGTVCRRQNTSAAEKIIRILAGQLLGTQLHGFGVKTLGLQRFGDVLASADSMSWSFTARREDPLPDCVGHKNCANCLPYARRWYDRLLARLQPLEVAA